MAHDVAAGILAAFGAQSARSAGIIRKKPTVRRRTPSK
jgi:hypothetical protein